MQVVKWFVLKDYVSKVTTCSKFLWMVKICSNNPDGPSPRVHSSHTKYDHCKNCASPFHACLDHEGFTSTKTNTVEFQCVISSTRPHRNNVIIDKNKSLSRKNNYISNKASFSYIQGLKLFVLTTTTTTTWSNAICGCGKSYKKFTKTIFCFYKHLYKWVVVNELQSYCSGMWTKMQSSSYI